LQSSVAETVAGAAWHPCCVGLLGSIVESGQGQLRRRAGGMRVDSPGRFGMTVERVEDALDNAGVFSAIAPALLYLLHPCSRMQAMILTGPPQASQVSSGTSLYPTALRQSATVQIGFPADLSISILNTRLSRCA
jgi:hypothetical protein